MRLADIIPVDVDHTRIPVEHMAIAKAVGMLDRDSQVFPWLDSHPRMWHVVYYYGGLWCVVDREIPESPVSITILHPMWI